MVTWDYYALTKARSRELDRELLETVSGASNTDRDSASLDDLAARYDCFRIEGPPELRANAGAGFEPPTGHHRN